MRSIREREAVHVSVAARPTAIDAMDVNDPEAGYESTHPIETWLIIWRKKWLVLASVVLAVGVSLLYAYTTASWYRAEVLLKPMDSRSSQGLASALGGLSGLASMAGLNIPNGGAAEAVAILTSHEFTEAFIEQQNLLPVLFAGKWDAAGKHWKSPDPRRQPDLRDAIKFFDKTVRTVQEDKKTGFVRMYIEWTDPQVAADWANLLVAQVNETMRKRALAEAETNVAFLKQELTSSNVVTLQQSIGRLLENELQKLMLAKGNKEYAFKILDHAQPPKWRSWPQRAVLAAAAAVAGLALAVIFLLAQQAVRRNQVLADSAGPVDGR